MHARAPAWIEFGAEARADGALLEDRDRRRQRPRPQQQRQIARRLHGEAAGDHPAAAEDRLADNRRADHLVVEHDRKGLADILAGSVGKAPRTLGIEAEADDRLVALECGLRIDQGVAADHHPLLDDIGVGSDARGLAFLGRQDFVADRQTAIARLVDRGAGVDQLKGQLGGASQQLLDMLGVGDAGQLHQDAILAFPLDGRLLDPGLVDAAANDLDRLIDGQLAFLLGRGGAERHRARPGRGDRHGQVRIDLGQRLAGIVDPAGFADREHDRIAFYREAGIADIRVEQRVADIVDDRIQALALRRRDIDLEQQIGPAAQVEPERHLLVRHHVRHPRQQGRAEQVRRREQHAERADRADQQDFPICEIQHAAASRVAGSRVTGRARCRTDAVGRSSMPPSARHPDPAMAVPPPVPRQPMPMIVPPRMGRSGLVARRRHRRAMVRRLVVRRAGWRRLGWRWDRWRRLGRRRAGWR